MTEIKAEFRFLDWPVYQDAKILMKDVFQIYNKLPRAISYSLGEQIIRSTSSIILNIAEGSGKSSDPELNKFFNIAIGSAYETLANVDILRDNGYISEAVFQNIFNNVQGVVRQLGGFKKKLKS
jgi:four helix bundle protein